MVRKYLIRAEFKGKEFQGRGHQDFILAGESLYYVRDEVQKNIVEAFPGIPNIEFDWKGSVVVVRSFR